MQALFHVDQFFGFAFEQPRDRDTGPARHDGGDLFGIDFLFEQCSLALQGFQLRFGSLNLLLDLPQVAVAQAGGFFEIGLALSPLDIQVGLFQLFL